MKNYIKNIIGIILLIVFLYFKFDGFHDFVDNNVLCHFFDVENCNNVKVQIDLLGLAKDNQRTHSEGELRPRGCWAQSGVDDDVNVENSEVSNEWVRPKKGVANIRSNVKFTSSKDHRQVLRMAKMEAMPQSLHNQNQADLERMYNEADAKIDEINQHSVERYKSYNEQSNSTTNGSAVQGKRYAPDYTGGKYMYWCTECGSWGAQHTHFDLK